jgi:hypothetical protein
MRPLISSFNDTAQELKILMQKEIKASQEHDIDALTQVFPSKMALYTKIEAIGESIKKCFSSFSKEEQIFLQNISKELDDLGQQNLLLLKGMMVASQKMMDILIYASQTSQDSLKVYDRRANMSQNKPFNYTKGV